MSKMRQKNFEHDAVFEQLPWFANGILRANERARVSSHLANCNVCRSELRLIEQTLNTITQTPVPEQADIEASLQRTQARIAAQPARARPSPRSTNQFESMRVTLHRWFARPVSMGFVTASVMLSVGTLIGLQWQQTQAPDPALYQVLTSESESHQTTLALRVHLTRALEPKQVSALLSDPKSSIQIKRVAATEYLLILPDTTDVQSISRLYDRMREQPEVSSVQVAIKESP